MTMFMLKVEIEPAPDDAARVIVAEVEAFAFKDEDVGDQVTVSKLPAFEGLQVFVAIDNVSATFPVFLT